MLILPVPNSGTNLVLGGWPLPSSLGLDAAGGVGIQGEGRVIMTLHTVHFALFRDTSPTTAGPRPGHDFCL